MTKLKATAKALKKEFGEHIGGRGAAYEVVDRIPTDWFQFDLSSGGGFPRGMVSLVYGPEGCGKTTLALRLIAQHQRRFPKLTCAWLDVENVFPPDWAVKMAVNVDDLYVFRPDFVEQAGDVVESILYADDCGLVILDSLAALDTSKSISQPMDKVQVAGASIMIKRMCNKITAALRLAAKEGRSPPTVVFINQIRSKIGVMFGNPETQPGGNTPRFTSSFTVRMWGKPIKDEKVSDVLPARREMQTAIQKTRIQNCATNAKWEMQLIAKPNYGIGMCDDWSDIKGYLEHYGLMQKEKDGYSVIANSDGEVTAYPTQDAIRMALLAQPHFMDVVRDAIIAAVAGESQV